MLSYQQKTQHKSVIAEVSITEDTDGTEDEYDLLDEV